ncbi:MAG: hypothetical protein AAF628_05380 [Planctomycetota bacterium]
MHLRPATDFAKPHGFFKPKCRTHRVPRFRCRTCGRTFSRQTFRADYRDHKPDRNQIVIILLCSGIGLRQTARVALMSRQGLAKKFRKIGRHLRQLNRNLRGPLPDDAVLQFDELETYEARRNSRPLTLPILIERPSRCILGMRSAPIRPSGTITPNRDRAIQADEARWGRRPSRSRAAVHSVLRRGAKLCEKLPRVRLETDEKSTYPTLAARAFGRERLEHECTSSKVARDTRNPLFPINHTEAMARDLNGRLRRESWLVIKRRWFLNLQLEIYAAFRNFVRPRFNGERKTPAQWVGWVDAPLSPNQLMAWRQDWGPRSGHPSSDSASPIHPTPSATA